MLEIINLHLYKTIFLFQFFNICYFFHSIFGSRLFFVWNGHSWIAVWDWVYFHILDFNLCGKRNIHKPQKQLKTKLNRKHSNKIELSNCFKTNPEIKRSVLCANGFSRSTNIRNGYNANVSHHLNVNWWYVSEMQSHRAMWREWLAIACSMVRYPICERYNLYFSDWSKEQIQKKNFRKQFLIVRFFALGLHQKDF